MKLTSITEAKLKCPDCGLVTTVEDALHDGDSGFESDGSLGCPRCWYVLKTKVFMKDVKIGKEC